MKQKKYKEKIIAIGIFILANIICPILVSKFENIDLKNAFTIMWKKIFEVIKFIRGEIEIGDNIENSIEETINYLSKNLNYTKKLIAKVTFIELVRANCWRISENADKEIIAKNVIYSKKMLEYYKNNN